MNHDFELFKALTLKGLKKQLDFSESKMKDIPDLDEDVALDFLSDIEDAIEAVVYESD